MNRTTFASVCAAALLLTACSMEQSKFESTFPTSYCQRIDECVGFDANGPAAEVAMDACIDDWSTEIAYYSSLSQCSYRGNYARQCIAAVENGGCDENTAVYYECGGVWEESEDDGDDENDCKMDTSPSSD